MANRRGLLFPGVSLLVGCLLTILGWSGTSSGALRRAVTGTDADDRLIAGQPRSVRSDEWLVATPLTVSQVEHGFARTNPDLGGGNDVSLPFTVPCADWSTVFRVESLPYLFLPLPNAFAAAWWLMSWILAVGAYALVLALLPGRHLLASALGTALLFAPFVQWWYIPATLMSLGWACWAAAAYIAAARATAPLRRWVLTAAVGYAAAALALVSYLPFTVPCALVGAAVCIGWTLRAGPEVPMRQRWREVMLGLIALVLAGAVVVVFLLSRRDLVTALATTSYPGHRRVPTGGGQLSRVLSGFLDRKLLSAEPTLGGFAPNASEASSFLPFGFYLLIPAGWLITRSVRRHQRPDGMLPCLAAAFLVLGLDLTVPGLDLLAKITGLSLVPHKRLVIGFGLLGLVLVAAVLREAERQKITWPRWLVGLTAASAVGVSAGTGFRVAQSAPAFAGPAVSFLGLAVIVGAICAALLRWPGVGAAGALLAGVLVSAPVNPLYRGVYDVRVTGLGQAIRDVDRPDPGGWVSVAGLTSTGVLTSAGVQHWSGVYGVPDPALWSWVDPTSRYRDTWNRYAYVLFTDDAATERVQLIQDDVIVVNVDLCSAIAGSHIRHILSDRMLPAGCLTLAATVRAGMRTYLLYDGPPA